MPISAFSSPLVQGAVALWWTWSLTKSPKGWRCSPSIARTRAMPSRSTPWRQLEKAIDKAAGAQALVIKGAGDRAFVSGGDLKELSALRTEEDAAAMAKRMRSICDQLAAFPAPVIAVLNGHAFGGGAEVAVAADIRVAADDIKIAFNQVTLEIMPAWGGAERLAALVGKSRALLLAGSGRAARRRRGRADRLGGRGVAPLLLRGRMAIGGQVAGSPPGGRDKTGNQRSFAGRGDSIFCTSVGCRRPLAGRRSGDEPHPRSRPAAGGVT